MSSDSDDDCYGKIAQKLQSMKQNYQEDKTKTKNILDDSFDLASDTTLRDLTTETNGLPSVSLLNKENCNIESTKEISLDSIIEQNNKKRKTRSRTKKSSDDDLYIPDEPTSRGRRKRSQRISAQERLAAQLEKIVAKAIDNVGNSSTSVSRGNTSSRSRGRRGRGSSRNRTGHTKRQYFQQTTAAPIFNFRQYSVGNTEEYDDLSESQDLFSSKPSDTIILEDHLDDPLENEELSVKVYWQSCEIIKFTLRRFQKFTQIYDYFVSNKNVAKEKLFFSYNDKVLSADDTPDAIDYNIGKFIEGGIVNQSFSPLQKKTKMDIAHGIKLKFQCQNVKKPFETVIEKSEKLSLAFMKCAEHLEKPIDKLKFYFDGDMISGKHTANDLELEGGECIDVVISS